MKRLVMAIAVLALTALSAHAAPSYLGTSNQDVTFTGQTQQLLVGTTENLKVEVTVQLPTGTNNIGTVSGSTVTSVLKDGAGNAVSVTNNRLDTNITGTADVSVSTVGVRGSQGQTITSESVDGGKIALDVLNKGRASLDGLSLVYKSSDNMIVGGTLTLTGKANQVDLQAIGNDCTFNIAGGDPINVAKNTGESFSFDYAATNLAINLTAKTGAAVCKVRMVGAN